MLRHDYSQSRLFVIKDPRACRFFPFWRDVLEEFGAAPAVAIPVRNPLEVMASLRRRDGFPLAKAALVWLRHVIDAERTTRDLPRAVVTYDALLSDWQGVIASLGAGLGVSWPRRGAATDLEIERFLATKLRHHEATSESLMARAEIVDWVKDAYAALVQLSSTPEHQASKARLDRVGAEFDKASAAFGVALLESERDLAQREAEGAELRARAGALEQRVAALSEMENTAGRLSAELDSAGAALAAERQSAGKLSAELDSAGAALAAERLSAGKLSAELDSAGTALAAERLSAGKLSAELDSAGAALAAEREIAAEQAARLAAIERDHALAQAGHAEAVEDTRRSRAERDALKEALEHAHRTLSAERQRAAERSDQLAELARERERAEASRAAAAEDVRQLRAELGVQARIAAEQSGMIGQFQAVQVRAEQESAVLGRRVAELEQSLAQEAGARRTAASNVFELEAEVARLAGENSDLAAQLEERTTRAARLESDVSAANRIVETSRATAAARAATLEDELSAAMRRAAEMEASYYRVNSELLSIKRIPWWGLLASARRISTRAATRANQRLITRSGLFDRDWYIRNYPEFDASTSDPVLDYLEQGAADGRDPGPLFLGRWYLEQYPDVRATGMNPLVHFLRHGAREGRNPSPLFETEWYRARYPDVRASGANPLVHYMRHGAAEGRDPGPFFATAWYLAEYPDVKAARINPLVHYLEFGMKEGRKPNPTGSRPPAGTAQATTQRLQTHIVPPQPIDRYAAWLTCNEFREPARRRLRAELAARGERVPRISVVMPVYETPQHLLDQAIRSVVDQVYEGWELCIADDASTAPDVVECLKAGGGRRTYPCGASRLQRRNRSGDEFGCGDRTRRVSGVPRPRRSPEPGRARRGRDPRRRSRRHRRHLQRRRQDRHERAPVRAAVQAGLVAGIAVVAHVRVPSSGHSPEHVRGARRHTGGVRRIAGLRPHAPRLRAGATDRPYPSGALSLARRAGFDGVVGRNQAPQFRRRAACRRRRLCASRFRCRDQPAGLGRGRQGRHVRGDLSRRRTAGVDPDSDEEPARSREDVPRLARHHHLPQFRGGDHRQRKRRSGDARLSLALRPPGAARRVSGPESFPSPTSSTRRCARSPRSSCCFSTTTPRSSPDDG